MPFYNSRDTLVSEMLSAITQTLGIERLETSEGTTVLVREGLKRAGDHVALISGGGSGHEPAHAGFIGEGMLTAAVPGSIFASPSVTAVLEAIRHVSGPAGCVLIVKNYTGDRLSFGLAAERARLEGIDVEVVLVADDVSLPGFDHPRGLAGTILVHKIAGAAAAAGLPLGEVAGLARAAAGSLRTVGISLGPVQLPGAHAEFGRGAELGMGIHNEPGAQAVTISGAADAVGRVLDLLDLRSSREPLIVMLNDLGGCSVQEGLVLTAELIRQIGSGRIVRLIGPVRAMTSFGMQGFSVTVLPAGEGVIDALEQHTDASAWVLPRRVSETRPNAVVSPMTSADSELSRSADGRIEAGLISGARVLIELREPLDALDRRAGDGDAGSTFADGAEALLNAVESGTLGFAVPAEAISRIAHILEAQMGGSSGVLLAILATAMSDALTRGEGWTSAFEQGLEAIMRHGGAAEGHSTMLDALLPAHRALKDGGALEDAAIAAEQGARRTAELAARAGRAAYVPDATSQAVEDPGARAIAAFLTAAAQATSTH